MIPSSKASVPTKNRKSYPQKRNCSDIKMSALTLSILAEECHPQYHRLTDRYLDETILEGGVEVEV